MLKTLDLTLPGAAQHYLAATHVLHNLPKFGWYDSYFIAKFEAAQKFLGIVNPDTLPAFVKAFEPLRTRPDFCIQHITNLLLQSEFEALVSALNNISSTTFKSYENADFGRHILHGYPALTKLQNELTLLVSNLAGEPVEPCYNFLSLYNGQGRCEPHMDAPSAKWTLDLCLDQNCDWPIHFSNVQPWPSVTQAANAYTPQQLAETGVSFKKYSLRPNEALLFSGSSQWHYRDVIPANGFCHLAFLHYHPTGTADLVNPNRWAEHFKLPELAILNSVYDNKYPIASK